MTAESDEREAGKQAKEEESAQAAAANKLAAQQLAAAKTAESVAAAQAAALKIAAEKISEARTFATQVTTPNVDTTKGEPKLRHEFVGMMFALAIGEVAVQASVLVRAGSWMHFLPAYSHLFLAAIVIAASWVGWTLSPSPGARQDVRNVFQFSFVVLLLDVFLVVVYFILAKTVDIAGEGTTKLNASARPETFWILVIFGAYFVWDVITKIVIYLLEHRGEGWARKYGSRMVPTVICFVMLWVAKPVLERADAPHVLSADLALLSLVLLFRALKGVAQLATEPRAAKAWPLFWTLLCLLGFGIGTLWTRSWPMPKAISDPILASPAPNELNRLPQSPQASPGLN
jgi:hypothetical protein